MPARYVSSRIVPWSRVRDQFGDQNVLLTFTSAVVGRRPSFLAAPRLAALSPRVSSPGREKHGGFPGVTGVDSRFSMAGRALRCGFPPIALFLHVDVYARKRRLIICPALPG